MAGRKVVPMAINNHHFTKAERQLRIEAEKKLQGGNNDITPPSWLDENAKEEFIRLASELIALDIICNADRAGLAIACDAYSKYILATTAIDKNTIDAQIIVRHDGKLIKKIPLRAAEVYSEIYRKYCAEYGLTPAARIKIAPSMAKEEELTTIGKILTNNKRDW